MGIQQYHAAEQKEFREGDTDTLAGVSRARHSVLGSIPDGTLI